MIYVLFVLGFVCLVFGADYLVKGASALAKRLHVSDIAIGLTIVAFGTSLPELVVSFIAGLHGSSDIAVGNVLGSNMFNTLLILGVTAIVYPIRILEKTVISEIPFSLMGAVLVGFLANAALFGEGAFLIGPIKGTILMVFFALFLAYIFRFAGDFDTANGIPVESKPMAISISVISIVAGLVMLVLGGRWVVNGAVEIARLIGLSETFIGLTIVAGGTSLPELFTSAVAAYRKNSDIAIGNIVGSNIFNALFILGIGSLVRPLAFQPAMNADIIVLILSTALLIVFVSIGKHFNLNRWKGICFILIYIAYIGYLIHRG
jgi:cation:H+ antiporter